MSTTMYTLSDFPAFAKLLQDTDDGKRDTHEADSCHGLLIEHDSVPSSDSNSPPRSSDSNFSSDFNECDMDEPHISVFRHIDDLKASADQSNCSDYDDRVIGGTIENENNHSINNPFRRRSNSSVPERSNNQPPRYTTAWSRDQLQKLRAIREEYYAQRDLGRDNERRAKLWTLVALASGPLLLATLWKRRFVHSFGFCCTCPDSAASSAASHASKIQFLARLTYGCHCVPRAGAVTLWQKIENFFFSITETRWLCVISAVAAIALFAWKWYDRNTSRRTSGTVRWCMPCRKSVRWLTSHPTSSAGHHHHNRPSYVPFSDLENVD